MSYGYIYKITHKDIPITYIGQSIHPYKRFKEHSFDLEYHTFEIIESCNSKEELDIAEKKWIEYYNSYLCGYNNTTGGSRGYIKDCKNRKSPLNKRIKPNGFKISFPFKFEGVDDDLNFIKIPIPKELIKIGLIDPDRHYLVNIREV